MKKAFKKLNLSKEVIVKLNLETIKGGSSPAFETRLSETCLCGSDPENC